MLRYPRFRIAGLWIPEYGSADNSRRFAWLPPYSPYHLREGVRYPAVLIATAESRYPGRSVARPQDDGAPAAGDVVGWPVLLRLESRAGHGEGKPLAKLLDELTDTWTFIWHELGLAAPEDR